MRCRGWWTAGVAGLVVIGVIISIAGYWSGPDDGPEPTTSEEDGLVTALVGRRVLTSVVVTRGQVVSPVQATVAAPPVPEGATKGVVTALPVAVGDVVAGGGAVGEVNGRPVLVWPSGLPLYRELRPNMSGPDVTAVQDALALLGHPVSGGERSTFGPETRAAVVEVYRAAGYEPTYTLGSAAAVEAAVASAGREADAALAAANAARAAGAIDPAAELAYEEARAEVSRVRANEGVTLSPGEVVASNALPATVLRHHVKVGGVTTEGADLVTIGSAELSVQVALSGGQATVLDGDLTAEVSTAGYQSECEAGPIVPASMAGQPSSPPSSQGDVDGESPSGGGAAGDGEGGDAAAVEGSDSEYPFVLELACSEPLPIALLGADVGVSVTVTGSEGPVLVVPATALATGGDGTTTVDRIEDSGNRPATEAVPVVVVGEADGFVGVTVSGDELREGDRVRVRR